ncbi:MAG: hypothetical protein ACOCW6_07595, partial [Spirochaetota bacterium]
MSKNKYASQELVDRMESLGIDVETATSILEEFNRGRFDNLEPVQASEIPGTDGTTVIDSRGDRSIRIDATEARRRLSAIDEGAAALLPQSGDVEVDNDTLRRI